MVLCIHARAQESRTHAQSRTRQYPHARTQVVLAGGFCFQVVDRMAGGTFNIAQPAWVYVWVYEPLIARTMGLWFLFNMIWLFVCGYSLLRSL